MPSPGPSHSGFPLPPQQYISAADGEEEAGTSWNLRIAVPITTTLNSQHPSAFQFFPESVAIIFASLAEWTNTILLN